MDSLGRSTQELSSDEIYDIETANPPIPILSAWEGKLSMGYYRCHFCKDLYNLYSMKKAETTCSVGRDPGLSKLCKKFTSISRWLYEDRVISIVPFKMSPSR